MDDVNKDDLIKYVLPFSNHDSMNINIILSDICNLACRYCTEHGRTHPWIELKKLKRLIKKIVSVYSWKKTRRYLILGGEPTVWPELKEFCRFLKKVDKNCVITLITNGTRTPRYWADISPHIDEVACSIHVSQVNIKQINENLKILVEKNIFVLAQILMDADYWEKAVSDAEWMLENGWAHLITLKPVEIMLGSQVLQDYTKEQLAYMEKWTGEVATSRRQFVISKQTKTINPFDLDGYGFITNKNKQLRLMNGELVSRGWDSVTGWHCFVNFDKLSILYNGKVKSGDSCLQGSFFGNFLTSDPNTWDWKLKPVICEYKRCLCGTDFETHKFKYKEDADQHLQLIEKKITPLTSI